MPRSASIPMQLMVASDSLSAHLHIMGDISNGSNSWFGKKESDTDSVDVAKALADLPDSVREVTVHINSMGGQVAQGVAIYNALKAHRAHVTTICEGFACSIASVIFMAGDERIMRNASLMMIHEAWMAAGGNARDLRKAAEDLETITELSKRAYMERANGSLTREMLDQMMADETWLLPEQAVEYGLATKVDAADDEGDAPEQSAMRSLMQLASGTAGRNVEPTQELLEFDPAPIAEEIAERVAKLMLQATTSEPKPGDGEGRDQKTFMQRGALLFA